MQTSRIATILTKVWLVSLEYSFFLYMYQTAYTYTFWIVHNFVPKTLFYITSISPIITCCVPEPNWYNELR